MSWPRWLIGGIDLRGAPVPRASLAAQVAARRRVRAPAAAQPPVHARHVGWIYDGVSVNAMAKPARRRESVHLAAIYRHHPLFAGPATTSGATISARPATSRAATSSSSGAAAVLVGMGERTRPARWSVLAQRLFAAGAATAGDRRRRCPQQRSTMHLDTVMTMVDRDAFTIYPGVARRA